MGKEVTELESNEQWSYVSVVGMLLYLAVNSHPEIAYAIHQCAHFMHNLKV